MRPLTSCRGLISLPVMRALLGLFKFAIFLISLVLLLIVASFFMLVGMIVFALTGRRPRFQIHNAKMGPQRPYRAQRPMKDVTPHNRDLNSLNQA